MPQGWRNSRRRRSNTSVLVASTPRSAKRLAQKSSESAGTDRSTSRAWFVPRRPTRPAWRHGKVVSTAAGSPAAFE